MKKITSSAEERLIEEAPKAARTQHKTLYTAFREWLARHTTGPRRARDYDRLMKRLRHVKVRRSFSRDEMNARRTGSA